MDGKNQSGYWYETTENGQTLLCFKVRQFGKKVVKKLELPEGVKELRPRETTEK